MNRRWLVPIAGVLVLACGHTTSTPIPDQDIAVGVLPGATEVDFGKAFPLTVVRVWRKDLVPREWTEQAFAPLAVQLEDSTRREDEHRIEETRRYRARAFTLGDVTVPALTLRATP